MCQPEVGDRVYVPHGRYGVIMRIATEPDLIEQGLHWWIRWDDENVTSPTPVSGLYVLAS